MRVGIAICTYNRVDTLRETVSRILRHTTTEHELIVIDDGSSDGTREAMTEMGVRVLSARNRGVAWNKNRALFFLKNFARSDAIIVIEDDTFPTEDGWEGRWMEAIARWGHINLAAHFWGHDLFHGGDGTAEHPYRSIHVSAQCAGFSSNSIEHVGYMDSRFRGWGMEHVDHTTRLIKSGFGGEAVTGLNRPLFYVINSNLEILFREESAGLDNDRKKELVSQSIEICKQIGKEKIRRDPWINDEEMAIFLSEFNPFRQTSLRFILATDEGWVPAHDVEQNRIRFVHGSELHSSAILREVVSIYDGVSLKLATCADGQTTFLLADVCGAVGAQDGSTSSEVAAFDVELDTRNGLYLKRNGSYATCDKAHRNTLHMDRPIASHWERFFFSHFQTAP